MESAFIDPRPLSQILTEVLSVALAHDETVNTAVYEMAGEALIESDGNKEKAITITIEKIKNYIRADMYKTASSILGAMVDLFLSEANWRVIACEYIEDIIENQQENPEM